MSEALSRAPRTPLVSPGEIDCHYRDMTATFSADVTLATAQQRLAEHEQWLPIDGAPHQSLGTLCSCNSTGPLRLGYGAWRDLLLGAQFINGAGELITVGGRTVKNVAGYDVTKFMVGQRGVFGRLVTLTTRTYHKPDQALLVRYAPEPSIVAELMPTPLKPQWALLTRESLLCGYFGDEPAIAYFERAVAATKPIEIRRRDLLDDIVQRQELWTADSDVVFRATVPPANLAALSRRLEETVWAADAAFGIVQGVVDVDRKPLRSRIEQAGGTVAFFEGLYGKPIDLTVSDGERKLLERLKAAFDSQQTLNPLPWRNA
jgi:hypothetical protein